MPAVPGLLLRRQFDAVAGFAARFGAAARLFADAPAAACFIEAVVDGDAVRLMDKRAYAAAPFAVGGHDGGLARAYGELSA
jgi:hypothetical protein